MVLKTSLNIQDGPKREYTRINIGLFTKYELGYPYKDSRQHDYKYYPNVCDTTEIYEWHKERFGEYPILMVDIPSYMSIKNLPKMNTNLIQLCRG